jgi:hypothetical protein
MPKRRGRPPKIKTVKVEIPKLFSHSDLTEALMYVEDLMDRAVTPFVVMGKISKQIYNENDPILEADKIELGVINTDMTRFCQGVLHQLLPTATFAENEKYFIHRSGVPVHIYKLENDNKYASNPDYKFFYVTQFRFPNPFDEFYKEYYG